MKTILIIEDNADNRTLLKDLLEIKGYQVLEAGDSEAGLRLAREQKPDLVLMDIQMHGVTGLTAGNDHPGIREKTAFICSSSFLPGHFLAARRADGWGEFPFLAQAQAGKVCETRRSDQPAKEEIKSPPARIKTTPPGQIAVRIAAGSLLLPRFYQSVYF